jgi:ParB family chromosome partitioning protein
VSDKQIEVLARDMDENGLQQPIEVLPDHTIVAGHCRVKAARRNGWEEIDAIIRCDLAEQGELAVEQYMIRDNCLRRQLSPLQRAQCALSLKELALRRQCDNQPLDHIAKAVIRQTPSTRDEIGGLLRISGREVSRLLRVLETPPEVQTAFDAGHLSLVLAEKVAGLDAAKQEAVAQSIRDGEGAAAAVRKVIAVAADPSLAATSIYGKLLNAVNCAVEVLNDRIKEIKVRDDQVAEHVGTLRNAEPLFRKLIEHEQAEKQRHEENLEKLFGDLRNTGG